MTLRKTLLWIPRLEKKKKKNLLKHTILMVTNKIKLLKMYTQLYWNTLIGW